MKENLRACVAFIAGSLIRGRKGASVYDYSNGKYIPIGGSVDPSVVNIFDYDQGCYVQGRGDGFRYSLYHYGEGCYIHLDIRDKSFRGYDYGSSSHFQGHVSGNSISVYDYGAGNYFNYSI